ncbi:MAG: carbon-nitrogen hydrolase family protein [Pirellulales bacterium]|nr:carbon-nitrogen hydrolase family protein [Pirellulales bacterium]
MDERFLAAAVQLNSREDKAANVAAAQHWIEAAAAAGARLIALPEMFTCYGRREAMLAAAEPIPGPTSELLAALAERLRITLIGGSLPEAASQPGKVFNTSLVFGPEGTLLARYRKIHLFDVDLPGRVTVCESNWSLPGDSIATCPTPCGTLGQAICYDLRFPELFRELSARQVELIVVPSAFTRATGRDHWELLIRARAVENQAFLIAPNQVGHHAPGLESYGHSLIVDPWGTPLAVAADEPGLAVAEIDRARLAEIRRNLPALAHRRLPFGAPRS